MNNFFMVRDESLEAEAEVNELRRLLEEAEARQQLITTGQGDLSWWDYLYYQVVWLVWGESPISHSRSRGVIAEWPEPYILPRGNDDPEMLEMGL